MLRHRFSIGYPRELAENLRVPLGQGIMLARRRRPGIPCVSAIRWNDPRYINAIDSVRSELAVPLMLRGKCVGVAGLFRAVTSITSRRSSRVS